MSSVPIMMMMLTMQQNHYRMEEENRRRREEERRRKQIEEEERRRQEEQRKMVEHRKNYPVVCNGETWQLDRCVKAISLQPCVQSLISTVEAVRPKVIEEEERIYDENIINVGYQYEVLRKKLDTDIETLKASGISINGSQYRLLRLAPSNANIGKPEQFMEFLGSVFTISNGQSIELNPDILSDKTYFEDRYDAMDPEEVERDFNETNAKMNKYHRFGRYLKFLLNTKGYSKLERHSKHITDEHEKCESRKRQMETFQSLSKEQLLAIKSYFNHLSSLSSVSNKLQKLFHEKADLRDSSNRRVYELTIKEVISNNEYNDLVEQVSEYIKRIYSNDEETMAEAYELVKGEYPISLSNRFIYDLIIDNLKDYKKKGTKELKLC